MVVCWAYVFGKDSCRNLKCKLMDTHNATVRAEFEASMSKDEFKQAREGQGESNLALQRQHVNSSGAVLTS